MRAVAAAAALAAAVLVAALSAAPARAAPSAPFTLQAARAEKPPVLDGTIADPAWQKAAHAELTWDLSFQRPAADRTDVYLLVDDKYLYVAFVAKQAEPLTATQRSNDIGLGSDDVVRVYLWPGGDKGFEYFFSANPMGTRYSYSSENTAFSPGWNAVAKTTPDGYVVTERIPLDIMRGDGRATWRIQFDRRVQRSDRLYEWAHADGQGSTDSVVYVGYLTGIVATTASVRTKPRLALYALGQRASAAGGGSTSRMGADFSLPITPTASFLGTLHPDYSNVELDQQTISPTAFQRFFQEVRPFFTQGTHVYNSFNCNDCVIYPFLYTPGIPTPSHGFAVEGVQGGASFAAFSSVLAGRSDTAQALALLTSDRRVRATILHEAVNEPGFTDQLTLGQFQINNNHNFGMYWTGGIDRGSNVTDPALASYQDVGLNLYTPKFGFFPAYRWAKAQFNPVDAFVPLTDLTGPSLFTNREFDFSPASYIRKIQVSEDIQRYHDRFGRIDETNTSTGISIDTRTLFTLDASMGAAWLVLPGQAGFTNQNGFSLSYGDSTSTPVTLSHSYGSYGAGYLNATTRSATFKLGTSLTSTIEADDDRFRPAGRPLLTQWLERASLAWQIGSESSLSVGIRRTIGTGPYFGAPSGYVNAYNVSSAYYRRFGRSEVYIVYGDPNSAATKPSAILKYIYYIGAEKGT